jgi:3-dehydroquinate dehydratase-2
MNVLVINGPNLARLDIRDSSIYGDMTYPQLVAHIENAAGTHGFKADIRQSDDEATIIGWIRIFQ